MTLLEAKNHMNKLVIMNDSFNYINNKPYYLDAIICKILNDGSWGYEVQLRDTNQNSIIITKLDTIKKYEREV